MFNNLIPKAYADVNIGDYFAPAIKGFTTIGFLVNILLPNILIVTGVAALVFVVIAGLKVIIDAGQGDTEKVAKNKGAFTAAVIGLIIVFASYLFVTQIVSKLIGVNVLNPDTMISP